MILKKLIDTIEDGETPHVLRTEVVQHLKNLTDKCAIEVENIQRGDVFWFTLVGGKIRPWVALSCRDGLVVAVAISTSASAPRMVKSACRYWPDNYIGATVSTFNEEEARKYVAHPYTNRDHLREIEAHIASLMDLRKLPGGTRSIEVPDQQDSRQVRRAAARKKALQTVKPRAPEVVVAANQAPRSAAK